MWNEPDAEFLDQIPRLYETEGIPLKDKLVYLHFFIFDCDYWLCEYDGEDTFFGFVRLNSDNISSEWGYVNFQELKEINFKGFEIENDISWEVKPAGEIPEIKSVRSTNNG